jgi:hypothetical protein
MIERMISTFFLSRLALRMKEASIFRVSIGKRCR